MCQTKEDEDLLMNLLSWGAENQTVYNPYNVEIYRDSITGLSFKAIQTLRPGLFVFLRIERCIGVI
jgi:hypothetical protein